MSMSNKYIQVIGKVSKYTDPAGERELIIFPEAPFWFIASKGGYDFINGLNGQPLEYLEGMDKSIQETLELLLDIGAVVLADTNDLKSDELPINSIYSINKVFPLLGAWVNIESVCNINCKHCFLGEKKYVIDKLTPREYRVLAEDLSKLGKGNEVKVDITGGEPLLRNDIVEIFEAFSKDGISINFITNGLLFTDNIVSYLARNKIETTISLDGVNQQEHEFIRGLGTFQTTYNNIVRCINAGIPTTMSMTIHRDNQDSAIEYAKLAYRLGAEKVIFNFLNDFGNASTYGLSLPDEHRITCELLNAAISDANVFAMLQDTAISKLIETVMYPIRTDCCGSGINTCSVGADGSVYPCPSFQDEKYNAGNIRNKSIIDIWNNIETFAEHRNIDINTMNSACKKCDFRLLCGGGCRAQAYYSKDCDIRAQSSKCNDYKKTLIDVIFMIHDNPILAQLQTKEGDNFAKENEPA